MDGVNEEGWFVTDFTLAELKTLRAIQPLSDRATSRTTASSRSPRLKGGAGPGQDRRPKARTVGVYPKPSTPPTTPSKGLPLEDRLLAVLAKYGYTTKASPVIQSFEVSNLKYLRTKTQVRLVQLVDANDVERRWQHGGGPLRQAL